MVLPELELPLDSWALEERSLPNSKVCVLKLEIGELGIETPSIGSIESAEIVPQGPDARSVRDGVVDGEDEEAVGCFFSCAQQRRPEERPLFEVEWSVRERLCACENRGVASRDHLYVQESFGRRGDVDEELPIPKREGRSEHFM